MKFTLMRHTVLLALILLASTATYAFTVSGTVTSAADGEPLIGASVKLLAARDSARVKTAVADADGRYALAGIAKGRYIVELSYVGYATRCQNITVGNRNVTVPATALTENALVLKEAVVTGIRTPIKVMEDTVEFAADTYKTQPNAVVEDLLKRLPGVEVGSDGKITANGKEVTKILVDGKEFFSDDPKVASKNLPVNIVDKLQVVDRKSDLARITGVDDGEEETVINLTVKKGMKNGWFGNAEAGYGTDGRYKASATVNRFMNDNQITMLAGSNNINEPGFTDGASGRFRRFGGDNGLTQSHAVGINFNVGNKEIFRVGGNVMYNHTRSKTITRQDRQYLFADSMSYLKSDKYALDRTNNVRADFRIQWNPDSLNTLDVRPRLFYSSSRSFANDSSLTQSGNLVDVTRSRNINNDRGHSWEFGTEVIYNHKFRNRPGRAFSVNARFNATNTRENEDTWSWNRFYLFNDSTDLYDQEQNNHSWTNQARARLSWTEPLGNPKRGNFLTLAYTINYRWNNSDLMTYDHPVTWPDGWLGNALVSDSLVWNQELSNQFRNDYMNQDIRVGYKHVNKKGSIDLGLSLVPQMSKSVDLIDSRRNITRHVLNFAPYMRLRLKLSKTRSFNANYRGRSSQPSISQLQPVADMSNPLRVTIGNPNLDPSFTHFLQLRFQDFNADKQRSIMAMAMAQVTQNSIVSRTTFNSETGGQLTTYENVNGVWNLMGMVMFSTPFRNRSWVFNVHTFGRYAHNVGFNNGQRNNSGSLNLNVMPSLAFRPDNLELEVRPRYSIQTTNNSLPTAGGAQTVHTYGGMFYGTYYTPFGLVLGTDLDYSATSGYAAGYDKKQCLWNASIAYRTLRDQSLVFTLKAYDLLQQKSNIRRNVTANYIDDTLYNSLTRYFMFTVSYTFNTFGKGNEPSSRNDMRRGPMGPPPGGGRGPGRPPRFL